MKTKMRFLVGTLLVAALCALAAEVRWLLPYVISNARVPGEDWLILAAMWSVVPIGLAGVLVLVLVLNFVLRR